MAKSIFEGLNSNQLNNGTKKCVLDEKRGLNSQQNNSITSSQKNNGLNSGQINKGTGGK